MASSIFVPPQCAHCAKVAFHWPPNLPCLGSRPVNLVRSAPGHGTLPNALPYARQSGCAEWTHGEVIRPALAFRARDVAPDNLLHPPLVRGTRASTGNQTSPHTPMLSFVPGFVALQIGSSTAGACNPSECSAGGVLPSGAGRLRAPRLPVEPPAPPRETTMCAASTNFLTTWLPRPIWRGQPLPKTLAAKAASS